MVLMMILKDEDIDAGRILLMILMTAMNMMMSSGVSDDDDGGIIDVDDNNDGGNDLYERWPIISRTMIVNMMVHNHMKDDGADNEHDDDMIDNDPDGRWSLR